MPLRRGFKSVLASRLSRLCLRAQFLGFRS